MRFRNTKTGRKHYAEVLTERAKAIVRNVAEDIYNFQVPAGSGDPLTQPEWTGFFRANWNISTNEPDFNTVAPNSSRAGSLPKSAAGMYGGKIEPNRAEAFFNGNGYENLTDIVFIANGTEYGQWLNNGGFDSDYGVKTHLRKWPRFGIGNVGGGSRFMELSMERVRQNMAKHIANAINQKSKN